MAGRARTSPRTCASTTSTPTAATTCRTSRSRASRLEELSNGYAARLREQFEGEHRRRYGFELDVADRDRHRALRRPGHAAADAVARRLTNGASSEDGIDRHEQVFFDGEWMETPIYERRQLARRAR